MNNTINATNDSLEFKYSSETKTELKNSTLLTETENTPTSLWTNVWYGLGMLAFILLPVYTPGITVKITVIGVFSLIIGVYLIAGISFLLRTKRSTVHRNRRKHR